MKKTYRINFADGTVSTVITCSPDELNRILHFHYTGKQVEGATVIEIVPKPSYVEFDSFIYSIKQNNIHETIDSDVYDGRIINDWFFKKTIDGLLCTPSTLYNNQTPVLVTTLDELRYILELIREIK